MKKYLQLITAVVWFIVGFWLIVNGYPQKSTLWLVIGGLNLCYFIRNSRNERFYTPTEPVPPQENTYTQHSHEKTAEQESSTVPDIVLSDEVHLIDDDMGYAYTVNKSFKPAKSHSAEVNLLSTYAPDDEYGNEGDMPCIAVMDSDDVYEAVEEFEHNGTFNAALFIEPLNGTFLFRAKMYSYGSLMYFYGFNTEDDDGIFGKGGLCLMYDKSYANTENEKKLKKVLDEAAASFHKT